MCSMKSIWYAVHKYVGETITFSQFTPVWGNGQFKPGKSDGGFKLWAEIGIGMVSNLYFEGIVDLVTAIKFPENIFSNIYN